jgi:hypothetical protein
MGVPCSLRGKAGKTSISQHESGTEADVRAKMLICLIENLLVEAGTEESDAAAPTR